MTTALKSLLVFGVFAVPMSSMIQMRGTIVWYPQFLTVLAICFLGLSIIVWGTSKPLAFLSVLCLFSYLFVCHQHPRALLMMLSAYAGIMLICFVSALPDRNVIWKALLAMACLQTLFVVCQALGFDPIFKDINNQDIRQTVGFVGSRNQLGLYYTAITSMLMSVHPWFLMVAAVPLFFSKCTSALIGAAFGLGLYIAFQNRKVVWHFLASLLVLFIGWRFYDNPGSEVRKERWSIIDLTMTQASEGKAWQKVGAGKQLVEWNPMVGAGIGGFTMISPKTQSDAIFVGFKHRYEHAHCDLAEFIFDFGWAGLAILFWALLDFIVIFAMSSKTKEIVVAFSGLCAIAVASFGIYSIHAPTSYFLFCLMIGLFLGAAHHENKSQGGPQAQTTPAWA